MKNILLSNVTEIVFLLFKSLRKFKKNAKIYIKDINNNTIIKN